MLNRLLFCVLIAVAVTAIYPSLLLLALPLWEFVLGRIDMQFTVLILRGMGIGFVGSYAVLRLTPRRKRK